MEKIRLTDKQIELINEYVKEASEILRISGIYLTAYQYKDFKTIYIDLQTVTDYSLDYNEKLTGKRMIRKDADEFERFFDLPRKYLERFLTHGIELKFSNTTDYCLSTVNRNRPTVKHDLANSSILFDRFGDIASIKEKLFALQCDTVFFKVEDIDAITKCKDTSNKKYIKKN